MSVLGSACTPEVHPGRGDHRSSIVTRVRALSAVVRLIAPMFRRFLFEQRKDSPEQHRTLRPNHEDVVAFMVSHGVLQFFLIQSVYALDTVRNGLQGIWTRCASKQASVVWHQWQEVLGDRTIQQGGGEEDVAPGQRVWVCNDTCGRYCVVQTLLSCNIVEGILAW